MPKNNKNHRYGKSHGPLYKLENRPNEYVPTKLRSLPKTNTQTNTTQVVFKGDASFLLRTDHHNNANASTLLLTLMMFAAIAPTLAQCNIPQGSYLDTCNATGQIYRPDDLRLRHIDFCEFTLQCKKLDGTLQNTTLFVQNSMSGCLRFFENCNGNPVMRDRGERQCIDLDSINRDSTLKLDL